MTVDFFFFIFFFHSLRAGIYYYQLEREELQCEEQRVKEKISDTTSSPRNSPRVEQRLRNFLGGAVWGYRRL
jgi:hypothetical protein